MALGPFQDKDGGSPFDEIILQQGELISDRLNILLKTIATHSPIAWAHINMLGEYDFSDETLQDSTGILPPKWSPIRSSHFGGSLNP
jgi:hypothetical protein